MTHVSRLDLEQEKVDLEACDFEAKLKYSKHKRDFDDMDALKRSYHAMELLSGTTANHLWVQNAKFYDIGKSCNSMSKREREREFTNDGRTQSIICLKCFFQTHMATSTTFSKYFSIWSGAIHATCWTLSLVGTMPRLYSTTCCLT